MNALVLKTETIVNIVRKEGEHYIDDNFNPYTKEELEFFIKQNENQNVEHEEIIFDSMNFNGMRFNVEEFTKSQLFASKIEKLLFLASSVIEQHPDFNPRQIADYVLTVYTIINKNVK